ncbi:MAG TPA: hypothetical protein VFQ60_01040, partial [Patescibacteria group bacterium]|nr:hypothetical protein [Patescibacteria group bacterium]
SNDHTDQNGTLEILENSVGTLTYVDALDPSDSTSTTMAMTFKAGSTNSGNTGGSSGGGGGYSGGGGSYSGGGSSVTTTVNPTANFTALGLAVNSLVKLPDDGDPKTQIDSAVYYLGSDGKRHAFPNEKVYFSWYKDFGGIKVVSAQAMASLTLGANITYKPGVRLVKFTTDPKVYAVDAGGTLRWVKTSAVAAQLYGSSWNKTSVDDISDAFFMNYRFGNDIQVASDYIRSAISAITPSDNIHS